MFRSRSVPWRPLLSAAPGRGRSGRGRSRLQTRIETMYVDKPDGRIDAGFFKRMVVQWRDEKTRCLRDIEQHQNVILLGRGRPVTRAGQIHPKAVRVAGGEGKNVAECLGDFCRTLTEWTVGFRSSGFSNRPD